MLEALDRGRHLGHAGEHDDRRVGIAPRAPPRRKRDPVHLGHVDVGDDQRDLALRLEHGERLGAGRRLRRQAKPWAG